MVAAVPPATQVLVLRDLGELYQKLDPKKATKLLTEAFSATANLEAKSRDVHQGKILSRLAEVNLDAALERVALYQPADPEAKPALYEGLVRTLLQREKAGAAVELFETYSGGNFPFKALDLLLEHLPPDDPRQVILFGRATTAYGASGGEKFPELLAKRSGKLPSASVQGAVGQILARVADAKFASGKSESLVGEKGPVMLQTAMDSVLFDTAHVIAQFEPKRLEEILVTRPALKAALDKYPKGRVSLGKNTATMSSSGDEQGEQRAAAMIGPFVAEQQMLERISQAAKKDPRAAIKTVDELTDTDLKARALATVVDAVHKDDPETARAVMGRGIEMLPKLERPMSVLMLVVSTFDEDSTNLLTTQMKQQLLEGFFASVGKFLKRDLDPDLPNIAERDEWPSTQLMRAVMMSVGAEMPDVAEPLLDQVKDASLRLLAQTALARGLLGEQLKSLNMNFATSSGKLPVNAF